MPANYVLAPFPSLTSVATFSRPAVRCPLPPPRLHPLPSPPSITPSGRATVTRRRRRLWRLRRHLGRGKHVASGEEEEARGGRGRGGGGGGGRGKFQLRLKKADRRSFAVGWCGERGDRAAGGRQVVFFTGKGISETRPYLGGREGEGGRGFLADERTRRGGKKAYCTYNQASSLQRGRQSADCVSPSLGGGRVAPGAAQEGRKEEEV